MFNCPTEEISCMRALRGTTTELHWVEIIVRGCGKLNVFNFSLWTAALVAIFDTITPTCSRLPPPPFCDLMHILS